MQKLSRMTVLYQEMQHYTKDTKNYKKDNMQVSKITLIKLISSNHNNKTSISENLSKQKFMSKRLMEHCYKFLRLLLDESYI